MFRQSTALVIGCLILLLLYEVSPVCASSKDAKRHKTFALQSISHRTIRDGQLASPAFRERKKRNANVATAEFSVSKQIEVFTGSGNPELFSIVVNGSTNSSVYDVTVTENVTELTVVEYVNPDVNSLNVQSSTVQYNAGNLTGSELLTFSYIATLRNLGTEIHFITTTISYFTSPQLNPASERLFTVDVCVEKVLNIINVSCDWCWCILIAFICFIVGFLLAFLLTVLRLLLCQSNVLPLNKESTTNTKQSEQKQAFNQQETIDIVNVIAMTNAKEVQNYLEFLEYQKRIWLEEEINLERRSTTESLLQIILNEEGHENEDFSVETREEKTTKHFSNEAFWFEKIQDLFKHHEKILQDKKREEELEEWQNKLNELDESFRIEMMSLIKQRQRCDVIDEEFLSKLKNILERCRELVFEEKEFEVSMGTRMQPRINDDVIRQFYDVESDHLDAMVKLYFDHLAELRKITKYRGEKIGKILDDLKKEMLIWEKMTSQRLEILQAVQRQNLISEQALRELTNKMEEQEEENRRNFEKELKKAQEQVRKNYRVKCENLHHLFRGHGNDVIDNDRDIASFLRRRIDDFSLKLKKELEIERQLDEVAFNYEDLLSAITSQTRRVMKRMKEDLAESLIQAGVNQNWLEDVYEKKKSELMKYYDAIDNLNVVSVVPLGLPVTSLTHDVTSEILRRVNLCQLMGGKEEDISALEQRNLNKKILLHSLTIHHAEKRYRDVMSDLERRRAAVNDVKSRTDEHEIRKELQEKLSIAERDKSFKKENKKTLARYKRHQSIKSRDDARVLLSDQLLTYFEQIKQKSDVSRERGSFEELTMTLLQMMTSSGKLTSRECRQVLEKFRSQREGTKRKFDLDRRRREEELKRRTENLILKRKYENFQLKFENSNSLEALLNYADGVGMTSSRSANDERLSIQELFKTRQLIQMELDEALIKEEVGWIRQLVSVVQVNQTEMIASLQLLLPCKSFEYVKQLSHMTCGDEDKKTKSTALKEKLFQRVKHLIIKKQQRITEILKTSKTSFLMKKPDSVMLPSGYHYPGVRPEPLGRTATPDKMY